MTKIKTSKNCWIYNHLIKNCYKATEHGRKKLRKTQINGSVYHVHALEELTSLKCPCHPKQFIDSTILIKIPMTYNTDIEQIFQKFISNHK